MNITGIQFFYQDFQIPVCFTDNPVTRVALESIEELNGIIEDASFSLSCGVQFLTDVARKGIQTGIEFIYWVVESVKSSISYLYSVAVSLAPVRTGGITSASNALNNPSSNCFMNASFQFFLADVDRRVWIRECLGVIGEAERLEVHPVDFAMTHWKENRAVLAPDWKEEFKGREGRVGDLLRITFGQAAREMLLLLDKWAIEALSSQDGVNLRKYALILSSYARSVDGRGMCNPFRLYENHLTIGAISLSCNEQADSVEFTTNFINSLRDLSGVNRGIECLEVHTRTTLNNGERRLDPPTSVTNIFVEGDRVDLARGFMSAYVNDFGEGEARLGTVTEIIALPRFLRMTIGLFWGEEKLFPREYVFNGERPFEIIIQDQNYRLDSFVVHSGNGMASGHYYTYVREMIEGMPTWVKYNDGYISHASSAEIEGFFQGRSGANCPYDLMFSRS